MASPRKRDSEAKWEEVRTAMEQNAYHLMRRGSIVAKWVSGGRRWVLRFSTPDSQGRAIHRSLYLGSDDTSEVLHRARELLRSYREQADNLEEIRLFARLAAHASALLHRSRRRRGHGRRRRRATRGEDVCGVRGRIG